MKIISEEMYEEIQDYFPKHRKPAKISNLTVLNALLYLLENGCKWRALPEVYGDWHVIYMRISRWAKQGVLETIFLQLQKLNIIRINVNIMSLDSTSIKVHPDGIGAPKKRGFNLLGKQEEVGTQNLMQLLHRIEML